MGVFPLGSVATSVETQGRLKGEVVSHKRGWDCLEHGVNPHKSDRGGQGASHG